MAFLLIRTTLVHKNWEEYSPSQMWFVVLLNILVHEHGVCVWSTSGDPENKNVQIFVIVNKSFAFYIFQPSVMSLAQRYFQQHRNQFTN